MKNIDESYLTYYAGPVSDHFDGTRFFNPWNPRPKKGFMNMLKWRMNGERALWPESVANEPSVPLTERLPESAVRVTYIGHATMLAQIGGLNVLIDPVFSERASPFTAIGPKRVRAPFLGLEGLPPIDAVFVSHNHYDHLDQMSLSWLARNRNPLFITPLGNTRLIEGCVENCRIVALDWHDSVPLRRDVSLTLVPAQHWSRRGLNDTNRDLWGGCVIKNRDEKSIFYVSDSGFHEKLFTGIKKRYGSPTLALIPIGAYEPRWFMGYSHMAPDDSIKTHKILSPLKSMGFHFETFQLTDEAFEAPRTATLLEAKKQGLAEKDFLVPDPGDFIEA